MPPITLRSPIPGDLGWVIHRHGVIYAQEYGWDWRFEGMVAKIAAEFIAQFNPEKDRGWIAERQGEILGSVFLARENDDTAKLRLLYVEPAARGTGLGKRLVGECLAFARSAGYRKVSLWTNKRLDAARKLYENAGFTLISEEPYENFGHSHVVQVWEVEL